VANVSPGNGFAANGLAANGLAGNGFAGNGSATSACCSDATAAPAGSVAIAGRDAGVAPAVAAEAGLTPTNATERSEVVRSRFSEDVDAVGFVGRGVSNCKASTMTCRAIDTASARRRLWRS
jgi:hypothetical protein